MGLGELAQHVAPVERRRLLGKAVRCGELGRGRAEIELLRGARVTPVEEQLDGGLVEAELGCPFAPLLAQSGPSML
jgi:hypothetical protein